MSADSAAPANPPKVSKRDMVIKEMMQTEGTYVKKLSTVIDVFMKPLREKKILDEEQIQLQFSSCETILAVHNTLYQRFVQTSFDEVGLLFKNFSDKLSVYEDYLVNFDIALTRRAALLMSNRKFAAFVEAARNDAACQGQALESYLIAPVQRIPRYRLLMEQLLKYTEESHPDHQNIVDALASIREIALAHNEAIRRRETKDKLMDIMMRFDFRCRENLLEGERSIVREGVLSKQCRRGVKDFTFWVFSDEILYGEQQIPGVGYYTSSRIISFSAFRLSPARNISNADLAFLVESPKKSFIVWTKSAAERESWMKDIAAAMEKHKSTREEETGNIAPVWTPDGDATECEQCTKQFSLINRRHHCRNCGAVVCDACSKKRFLVAHIDQNKESRVCDPCYGELMEMLNNGGSSLGGNGASAECDNGGSDPTSPISTSGKVNSNLPKRGRQSIMLRGLESGGPGTGSAPSSATISPATSEASMSPMRGMLTRIGTAFGGSSSSSSSSSNSHSVSGTDTGNGIGNGSASSVFTDSAAPVVDESESPPPSEAPPPLPSAPPPAIPPPDIVLPPAEVVAVAAAAANAPAKKPSASTLLQPGFRSTHKEVESLRNGTVWVDNPLKKPLESLRRKAHSPEASASSSSSTASTSSTDLPVAGSAEGTESARPTSARVALPAKPSVPKKPAKIVVN